MHGFQRWIGVEQRLDVGEQADAESFAVGLALNRHSGNSGPGTKLFDAVTHVGDGQQEDPVILAPVLKLLRYRRLRIEQRFLVVARPAAKAATQIGQLSSLRLNFSIGSSFLRRRSSTKMHRLNVGGGSFRPTMPIAFGANVGNSSGVLSSPIQRNTPVPRVWPLLITERSAALSSSARMLSNSSKQKDGLQRLIAR